MRAEVKMVRVKVKKSKFVEPKDKDGSIASFPAMPLEQNAQRFYLATIPVFDIFPYCFVSRREEDPILGFQRTLSEPRAKDIAKYLDDSHGSIPTNIVLSAQNTADLNYSSKTKTIKYARHRHSFLVIDGQHRLYGYGMTKGEHRIPVAIYTGLTRQDEASLFIDINTNQKGVPAALLLDIKQLAERETQIEGYLRTFFDKLNDDSSSPFCGYLSPSSSARGKISRVTFNRGIKIILQTRIMEKIDREIQYKLLKNYFKAVESNLTDFKLLLKAVYFEAFCEMFEQITNLSHKQFSDYKYESLSEILFKLRNIDISALSTSGQTILTKTTVLNYLKTIFLTDIQVSDEMI
jgi:DGQHR domain-containing protein